MSPNSLKEWGQVVMDLLAPLIQRLLDSLGRYSKEKEVKEKIDAVKKAKTEEEIDKALEELSRIKPR